MAFGASEEIWSGDLLSEVQQNLTTIAQTIAEYEPVSMLVRVHGSGMDASFQPDDGGSNSRRNGLPSPHESGAGYSIV